MLEDKREFPCRTIHISPDHICLSAPSRGTLFERVIVYLDYIGRIEGTLTENTFNGFNLTPTLTAAKREKIADTLTWLLNREKLGKADRRHDRIVPNLRHCILKMDSDREHLVRLIDISVSGAAVITDLDIPLGTKITLGSRKGHVIRLLENGIAVQFESPIPIQQFGEDIRL
jgi:hypothetical protein